MTIREASTRSLSRPQRTRLHWVITTERSNRLLDRHPLCKCQLKTNQVARSSLMAMMIVKETLVCCRASIQSAGQQKNAQLTSMKIKLSSVGWAKVSSPQTPLLRRILLKLIQNVSSLLKSWLRQIPHFFRLSKVRWLTFLSRRRKSNSHLAPSSLNRDSSISSREEVVL